MIARFRFTLVALAAAVGLLSWGAFVTSIDAGLAVPDWPTSFSSYDPFNPWPDWWTVTPVLAEHGHRLAGALVGLLTLVLAVWTAVSDPRGWMKRVGWAALVLVVVQGVLGGLRVVWVSLDLAVVHACTAQLFFALLASMALFVSNSWQTLPGTRTRLERAAVALPGTHASAAIFVQIALGALLRHPGTGIDPILAGLHLFWAGVTLVLTLRHAAWLRTAWATHPLAGRFSRAIGLVVLLQIALGFVAYFVLLDEQGVLRPSNLQVVVNSLHLVVGAALFSLNVVATVAASRAANPAPGPVPVSA